MVNNLGQSVQSNPRFKPIEVSEVGGGESAAAPTGNLFRFVGACERAGACARSMAVIQVHLQDDCVRLLVAGRGLWPFRG